MRGGPIARAAACALLLAGCAAPRAAREGGIARGVVFHDRDGDGARGWSEGGIRGVAVSNGRDVVRSDWRGRYALPVGDDTVLFVVKPRGWMTPVDRDQLPRFYYVHKPAGSPAHLRYPGVAPTGGLPASVDFPLRRHPEPDAFRMILFGDTQPYDRREIGYIERDVVDELEGTDAAFGMTLGDVVGDDLALFEPLNRAISRIGIPWYNVHGNHDMNLDAAGDRDSDETWERVYGPTTYAFQYGRVHVIVLDDVIYGGATPGIDPGSNYAGGLGADPLAFVEAYLAGVPGDELVLVALHIPLGGRSARLDMAQRGELLRLLSGRPHTLSVSAHTHFQAHRFFGPDDGFEGPGLHHHLVHATVSGSWWLGAPDGAGIPHATMRCGAPNGYSFIDFDGPRYAVRFKAAREPAAHQMNVYAPPVVSASELAQSEVLVNVFSGSERSRVELRIDDGAWLPLTRVEREDPGYAAAVEEEARAPGSRRPLPPPMPSPHLWAGRLPADAATGERRLEVRTTDMFGRTFTARRPLRIE